MSAGFTMCHNAKKTTGVYSISHRYILFDYKISNISCLHWVDYKSISIDPYALSHNKAVLVGSNIV